MQSFARFFRRLRCPDQCDQSVNVIQRLLESQQDVLAVARLAQQVIRSAPDDIDPVIDEFAQELQQPQFARLAVDNRQHDHAEIHLQLGVLVEVVQDHLGLFTALQFEHNAHAVAVALVANLRNTFDPLLVHQFGGLGDHPRLVHLERDLGNDDRLAIPA